MKCAICQVGPGRGSVVDLDAAVQVAGWTLCTAHARHAARAAQVWRRHRPDASLSALLADELARLLVDAQVAAAAAQRPTVETADDRLA